MVVGYINAQESKKEYTGFSKGNIFMTGSVGVRSLENTANNYKENSFNFSPRAGFFVSNNIVLGLGLEISNISRQQTSVSQTFEQRNFGIIVFGRYYFSPSNNFTFFTQAQIDYLTSNITNLNIKSTGVGFGIAPGISYFISDNFAIETSLGILSYASAKADVPNAQSSTDLNIGIDFSQTRFGVLYKF